MKNQQRIIKNNQQKINKVHFGCPTLHSGCPALQSGCPVSTRRAGMAVEPALALILIYQAIIALILPWQSGQWRPYWGLWKANPAVCMCFTSHPQSNYGLHNHRSFSQTIHSCGWHQWKEIWICSKSKEFKSNRWEITKFGPNFRTIFVGARGLSFFIFSCFYTQYIISFGRSWFYLV